MSLIRVYPQHWFSPRNAQQPEQSFQPLDRLHHDIDRLFNGFFTPGWPTSLMDKPQADIRPSLDIHSDDKAYTIHMEVPGVDPDEVKVEVRDGMLTVEGEKKMESCAAPAAEGEKEAAILRADAVKQQRILEAEGEAQAILAVQKANADAIRLLNEAMPSDKVLAIRSLEALAKVANGKATKIIIPSELQNLGGVVPSIKELMTDPKDAE